MPVMSPVKTDRNDVKLTKQQTLEWMKCKNDCLYFLENYVMVQHPTKGAIKFILRPYQRRSLKMMVKHNQMIMLQPRQTGKSALIVAYCLWLTIFNPDFKIGIAAHKNSGALELVARFQYAYENLPNWLKPAVKSYNKHDVEFYNGSLILSQATTEMTFRGLSLSMVYLDEFAFVKPLVAAEFWASILPALTAGGINGARAIITSTPNGTEGMFAELWFKAERGESTFMPFRVKNEEVPGREKPEFKEFMLQSMSPEKYAIEYDCQFLSESPTLIKGKYIEEIVPKEPVRAMHRDRLNNLHLWCDSFEGRKVGVAVDVSEGILQDSSVIQIVDLQTFEQIGCYASNDENPTEITKTLVWVMYKIMLEGANSIHYTVEANSIGQAVLHLLLNMEHEVLHFAELVSENHKRDGILSTTTTKKKGCMILKDFVENKKLLINDRRIVSEFKFFVKKGQKFEAETGLHDDHVMSMVLMMLMIEILIWEDEEIEEAFNNRTDDIVCFDNMYDDDSYMPVVC